MRLVPPLTLGLCLVLSLLFVLAATPSVFAEGSRQVGVNQPLYEYSSSGIEPRTLFVDIASAGEVINVMVCGESDPDNLTIEVYGPSGTLLGTDSFTTSNDCKWDFDADSLTPYKYTTTASGVHEVRLINTSGSQQLFERFDISVTASTAIPPDPDAAAGRLWALRWRFNTGDYIEANSTDANYYILTPGGRPSTNYVWMLDLNNFSGYLYELNANATGVSPDAGYSVTESGHTVTPLYPMYVGYPTSVDPEPTNPPALDNLTFIDDAGQDQGFSPGTTASTQDSGFFNFTTDVDGTYAITIDTNQDDVFGVGDRLLLGMAVNGANSVEWDGRDPDGSVVPEGTYEARIQVRIGEYHFVAEDVETSGGPSDEGLTIFRATSATTTAAVSVFWDDETFLSGDSTLPNGALSSTPAGRHTWGEFDDDGIGNDAYLDTYVYGLATTEIAYAVVVSNDDPLPDSDLDGVVDAIDADDDNDGIPDSVEGIADTDGDGVIDALDLDSDNDGIPDLVEAGGPDTDNDGRVDGFADTNGDGLDDALTATPLTISDTDADGHDDQVDLDADNDGIPDLVEAGGSDADNDATVDGFTDADLDGLDDTIASTPLPRPNSDSDTFPDHLDIDADGDGIVDNIEAQGSPPAYWPPGTADSDNDGWVNEYDSDNGGTAITLVDTDLDTIFDYLDNDSDADGVPDAVEAHDVDANGVADILPADADADGDGLDDSYDTLALPASGNSTGSSTPLPNLDLDAEPDWRDVDDDGDGINTILEDANGNGDPTDDDADGDSVPDYLDDDDADGDGVPDTVDLDLDNDGIPNSVEGMGDIDGDGIANQVDRDSDGDGIPDVTEAGGVDADGDGAIDTFTDGNGDGLDDALAASPLPLTSTDADPNPNYLDVDSDADGLVDNVEAQGNGAGYRAPAGADTDGDGIDDEYDSDDGGTPIVLTNSDVDADFDYLDADSDDDGVPDSIEGHDANRDGVADVIAGATDSDADGLDDAFDTINAPDPGNAAGSNAPRQDTDSDGNPDWRDTDDDGDGIQTAAEDDNNNGDFADDDADGDGTPSYLDNDDVDGDGVPDASDLDRDNDGIPNSSEGTGDLDGDGLTNDLDRDADGDGIPDTREVGATDADGDGVIDVFNDGNSDGLDDALAASPLPLTNSDGDPNPDFLDIDADGDGIVDNVEAQPTGTGYRSPSGTDTDGDGLDDEYDADNGGTAIAIVNTDGDADADHLDSDADDDGVVDAIEGHDANADGVADTTPLSADSDLDGLDNAYDVVTLPAAGNATGANTPLPDLDLDTMHDWRDVDDDGDSVATSAEDNNGNDNFADDDADGDGTPDYLDAIFSPFLFTETAVDVNGGTLEAGDEILYTFTVTKLGTIDADQVSMRSALPANTTYIPGSLTLNGTSIADVNGDPVTVAGLALQSPGAAAGVISAGDSATVTLRVLVSDDVVPGSVISSQGTLLAEAPTGSALPEQLSDDPSTTEPADATVLVTGAAPRVVAMMTASDTNGPPLAAGDTVIYTVRVRNIGTADATEVSFTDVVPTGATYVPGSLRYDADGSGVMAASPLTDAADGDVGSFGANTVSLAVGTLASGADVLLTFEVTIDAVPAGTVISNQGTVASAEQTSTPTDADGNSGNGTQPSLLVVGTQPAISIEKRVLDLNGSAILAGDTIEYVIEITNYSATDATNVNVTEPSIPTGVTYVAESTTVNGVGAADIGGSSPLLTGLNLPLLAAASTTTIRFRTTIDAGLADGTDIDNVASFTAGALADSSAPDPAHIEVGGTPGVGSLSGFVWQDFNHDRLRDPSEPAVPGWVVELLQNGAVVATTTTDASGRYDFTGIIPGSGYGLRFLHPTSGATFGTPVSDVPGTDVSAGFIDNLTIGVGAFIVEQGLPLDPSGIVYDASARTPIAGAIATFIGPMGVVPDALLFPGQQNQVTGADGFYRFDLVAGFPAGTYTIQITPPGGFQPVFPSNVIAPEPGSLDATGLVDPFAVVPGATAPQVGDPTTYYLSFDLAPGDANVVNNHIPLDATTTDMVHVVITTPARDVSRAELVPYAISVTNTDPLALTDVVLRNELPPGFKYVPGSARVDDVPVEPTLVGRTLVFPNFDLAVGQERIVRLLLVVGSAVTEGEYVSSAWAAFANGTSPISNIAGAGVRVIPDPVFDCSDILGKVFDDRNANGIQDEGEHGLAGVRIATVNGLLITTDSEGRYHVTCPDVPDETRGSNFTLKVDTRTLPGGYQVTTENPRVIRLTRGKTSLANFGATRYSIVTIETTGAAFGPTGLHPQFRNQLSRVVEALRRGPSNLRLILHRAPGVEHAVALDQIQCLEHEVHAIWEQSGSEFPVEFEAIIKEPVPPRKEGRNSTQGASVEAVARDPLAIRTTPPPAVVLAPRARAAAPKPGADLPTSFAQQRRSAEQPGSGLALPPENAHPTVAARQDETTLQPVADTGDLRGGSVPFRIHVDDQIVAASPSVDAASGVDIRVRYDGLSSQRRLSVSATPATPLRGEPVHFRAFSNYDHYIARAEIRIFAPRASVRGKPMVVIPLDAAAAQWRAPLVAHTNLVYVLRVYNASGLFDETEARELRVHNSPKPGFEDFSEDDELLAFGENHLARQAIPVHGGTVTVTGSGIPSGAQVMVFNHAVPVDSRGRFAVEQVMPSGAHTVSVKLAATDGDIVTFERDLLVPHEDWFFVGIADLLVGGGSTASKAELVTGDSTLDERGFARGRLAFYLKGLIKGEYLITASLDTRQEQLPDLLKNFWRKDRGDLLREIDPDRYYPVYGDDSITEEDAPTQGRLYVRIERGESHILWGNFTTQINGTDLAQVDRRVYGAQLHYQTEGTTSAGEPRSVVDAHVAEPETVSARDEFRGTGGSLYHLRRRHIAAGSDRLRIEIRDKDTDLVLSVRDLIPHEDYDLEPIFGRVLLTQPLASTSTDDLVVRQGGLSGHRVYLVARYEYIPDTTNLQDSSAAGRATHWLTDWLQVGLTASHDDQAVGDQELLAADLTLLHNGKNYVRMEVARTDGPGAGEFRSLDGGFSFAGIDQDRAPRVDAFGWRVEAGFDLLEFDLEGEGSAYFQRREAGFSAPGQLAARDTNQYGVNLRTPLFEDGTLYGKFDETKQRGGVDKFAAEVNWTHADEGAWRETIGLRSDRLAGATTLGSSRDGSRTDATVEVGYAPRDKDWEAYAFAQGTVHRTGNRNENNRAGVGGNVQVTERMRVGGEVSGGNGGLGGRVSTDYLVDDRTTLYLAYDVETDDPRLGNGSRTGSLVTGSRYRYSSATSVFVEQRFDHGRSVSGLSHVLGVDLAPAERWTASFTAERGDLELDSTGELQREAASLGGGYTFARGRAAASVEYRRDRSDAESRSTWLLRNNGSYEVDPDWRLLGKANYSDSDSNLGGAFDAEFTELSVGAAYRPVAHDKFNGLLRYTYLMDLPSPGQLSATGVPSLTAQRSHVLSADANYQLCDWWTLGAKYAYRISKIRESRDSGPWFKSSAHLAILRADFHIIKEWDAVIEGRWLRVEEADDARLGTLVGIYRHVGDSVRVGVGYNFTDFSDDITDLDYEHHGWFLNITASF